MPRVTLKNIDIFEKNIIIVFLGVSLANLFNLIYQLLIAHRLNPADFAAFNSLLALYMLVSTPLATIHIGVVKHTAAFNATAGREKVKFLLSQLLRLTFILAISALIIFYLAAPLIKAKLKIDSLASVYILGLALFLSWMMPVLSGGLQGMELFQWLMSASIIGGLLKIALTFLFIALAFGVAGALGAFLVSNLVVLLISFFPLRHLFCFKGQASDAAELRGFFLYLLPVAISSFCFIALVNFDMVLVKYFFSPEESGLYSLAQMVGKIFLFFPGAINTVMFPRVSGLNAKKEETISTLKKSLLYSALLGGVAALVYNIFPYLILKILTGKAYPEAIFLGRLFSISMFFFMLLNIIMGYFLSLNDFRFVGYLVFFALLQFILIVLFHASLLQVAAVLCLNSAIAFLSHLVLLGRKGRPSF